MNIDFNKNNDGLVPVIIQDANTKKRIDVRLYEPRSFKSNSRH